MSHLASSITALPMPVVVAVGLLGLLQLCLDVLALVDLYRRPVTQVALANKWIWVAIILLVGLLGAILYLAIGRQPAPSKDVSSQASRPQEEVRKIVDSLFGTPPRPDDRK